MVKTLVLNNLEVFSSNPNRGFRSSRGSRSSGTHLFSSNWSLSWAGVGATAYDLPVALLLRCLGRGFTRHVLGFFLVRSSPSEVTWCLFAGYSTRDSSKRVVKKKYLFTFSFSSLFGYCIIRHFNLA